MAQEKSSETTEFLRQAQLRPLKALLYPSLIRRAPGSLSLSYLTGFGESTLVLIREPDGSR